MYITLLKQKGFDDLNGEIMVSQVLDKYVKFP